MFARAYLRMTQLYGHTREIPGYYEDLPAFNHLDAVFAKYYFDAYYNWKNGNRSAVPQSWLVALDAAKNKKVTGSGDLLLGMNAHINRDLAFVLAASGLVPPRARLSSATTTRWSSGCTTPGAADGRVRREVRPHDGRLQRPLGAGYWATFQMVSALAGGRLAQRRGAGVGTDGVGPGRGRRLDRGRGQRRRQPAAPQAYTPPLTSTTARDAYCAGHKGDAPPMPYDFGYADPWGFAY